MGQHPRRSARRAKIRAAEAARNNARKALDNELILLMRSGEFITNTTVKKIEGLVKVAQKGSSYNTDLKVKLENYVNTREQSFAKAKELKAKQKRIKLVAKRAKLISSIILATGAAMVLVWFIANYYETLDAFFTSLV